LVFLPGAAEIRRASEELEGPAKSLGFDVVPLHGDLPAEQQDRAVRPGPRRKVILSTNVAETSLTIEGVVAVVDSGLARMARTSPWTGLSSLDTVPISRASAAQRAGRAGRVRPGVCVRLYTKGDHDARPLRDRPEIERVDLAPMVLSLRAAGEDPRAFDYLEAPPPAALDAAEALLARLGAIEGSEVTELGRAMLALPLHPRLARVALEAHRRGHSRAGALLAALIGERDVRLASRARFGAHGHGARDDEVASSDLVARMDELEAAGGSASALRASGLDARTVRTVLEAARQIEQALADVRLDGPETFDEEDALLIATLAGFPDRVARRRRPGSDELVLAGGGSARLDPASAVKDAALLVAVDAESQRGGVLVRRASAVTVEMLMELFLDRIEDVREARFDAARERVVGVAELRYDGLALEQSEVEPSDEEAARVLADAALAAGIGRFVDEEAWIALTRRLRFARTYDPSLPQLDEAWLRALLVRLCEGKRSFAELESAGLLEHARAELAGVQSRLDEIAPEHVSLPGRRRVPVTYEDDRPPWIASRLADFFGMTEGPTVALGRVPLVLHLLAPNHRALQVTTDLAGFWEKHYPELRRSLMRRYPRHPWPEDPRTASPPEPKRPR
ncbi:MAG TPA: ATP-dependent helicase C-terminal domain-containing protein, partial [Sandaracinaceae bacterium]